MNSIAVLITCYNRCSKTENCIRTLLNQKGEIALNYIIADDGSTDGTMNMLTHIADETHLTILQGNGNWFYSGGMSQAITYAIEKLNESFDYVLMVNDDVDFFDGIVARIVELSKQNDDAIIVGATCDESGNQTYGAIKYVKGIKYKTLTIEEGKVPADTFNANCVLLPRATFLDIGYMDKSYVHALGDFDYGLQASKRGHLILTTNFYVGKCEKNTVKGTWLDTSLTRIERLKKKETIKGAPFRQWFHFLNKNFGLQKAIMSSITPYLRIILGR